MSAHDRNRNRNDNPFKDSDFTALFDELYLPLCRFCMNIVGVKEEAEDIVQEQFVYVWENNKKLNQKASIKSYLYTLVKHRSIDHLRKKFNKSRERIENIPAISLTDSLPTSEEILEAAELKTIINKALSHLPEKCRAIFTMKRFGELSNKEIAEKLGLSVKTVENQMTIAIRKLLVYISEHWN